MFIFSNLLLKPIFALLGRKELMKVGVVSARTRKFFSLFMVSAFSEGDGHSSGNILIFEIFFRAWHVVAYFKR